MKSSPVATTRIANVAVGSTTVVIDDGSYVGIAMAMLKRVSSYLSPFELVPNSMQAAYSPYLVVGLLGHERLTLPLNQLGIMNGVE